jgi:hypothetical protein
VWSGGNPFIEAAYYPGVERGIAMNLSAEPQSTLIRDGSGGSLRVELGPEARRWFHREELA